MVVLIYIPVHRGRPGVTKFYLHKALIQTVPHLQFYTFSPYHSFPLAGIFLVLQLSCNCGEVGCAMSTPGFPLSLQLGSHLFSCVFVS